MTICKQFIPLQAFKRFKLSCRVFFLRTNQIRIEVGKSEFRHARKISKSSCSLLRPKNQCAPVAVSHVIKDKGSGVENVMRHVTAILRSRRHGATKQAFLVGQGTILGPRLIRLLSSGVFSQSLLLLPTAK